MPSTFTAAKRSFRPCRARTLLAPSRRSCASSRPIPATDWSKVNISALREHLIDMDEVTMRARRERAALDNGLEITVTGQGRTLGAIKRMVPAHAHELAALGWERDDPGLCRTG